MADPMPRYAKPADPDPMLLRVRPRLASWNAADHPDQQRLEEFLAHAVDLCRPRLTATPDPLALCLDVGLPATTSLLDAHDLDNYLFPLTSRLSKDCGRQFVSVWGTKRHAEASYLHLAQAVPQPELPWPGPVFTVRTNTSGTSVTFKQQIDQQLAGALPLPDGPIGLHIGFRVGPRRNWANLWKPTIDSLDRLLGRTTPHQAWHPRDGRITELGLSNHIDPTLGHDVVIYISASHLPQHG